ncbi:putative PurR-regulated permease PerM [Bacilli bacterium PM5-3]|nr:putative PurR-regulated permease PerM [Bacilli bacterium PM5-3]MDH6604136.1 putative PurR-regulated permease PerM [Bacilli bacterium PM5-9]
MELNSSNIKKILLIIIFAAFIFWSGQNFLKIIALLLYVLSVFTPLILGFCIAFVLNVFMRPLEAKLDKNIKINNKIKRPICLIIVVLLVFFVLFILSFMIIPEISRSISSIIEMFPTYMDQLEQNVNLMIEKYQLSFIDISSLEIDWNKFTASIGSFLSNGGKSFFDTTLNLTSSIFSGLVNFVLGFVFAIYMLLQKEKLTFQVKKTMFAFFNEEHVNEAIRIGGIANNIFSKFVTGQLLEACIIGILCFIGMSILQMPYATMISSLVGFTALIPVVGAFIGTIVGAFLILLISPIKAFWFVVFIIILQQFEGNLIYPKVVGKSVGLPGIWVLSAVTIGGSLNGIIGMLISVPLCSVLYILLKDEVNKRIKNKSIKI